MKKEVLQMIQVDIFQGSASKQYIPRNVYCHREVIQYSKLFQWIYFRFIPLKTLTTKNQ